MNNEIVLFVKNEIEFSLERINENEWFAIAFEERSIDLTEWPSEEEFSELIGEEVRFSENLHANERILALIGEQK